MIEKDKKYQIQVYLDNGNIYEYDVKGYHSAREHSAAIVKDGYRHNPGKGYMEHFPPHRIVKVKVVGDVPTKYPDRVVGT